MSYAIADATNYMTWIKITLQWPHILIKKAFDTVDHRILLKKLDFYSIRGM